MNISIIIILLLRTFTAELKNVEARAVWQRGCGIQVLKRLFLWANITCWYLFFVSDVAAGIATVRVQCQSAGWSVSVCAEWCQRGSSTADRTECCQSAVSSTDCGGRCYKERESSK